MQPQGLGYKPPQAHGRVPPHAVAKVDGNLLKPGGLEKERHGYVGQVEILRYPLRRGRRKGRVIKPERHVGVIEPGAARDLQRRPEDLADQPTGWPVVPGDPPAVDRGSVVAPLPDARKPGRVALPVRVDLEDEGRA